MPPAFTFRRGATPEACLDALGMGLLRNARVTSTSRLKQNGTELQQLNLAGINGTAVAEFAGDTRMLKSLRIDVTPPGASADTKVSAMISFAPRIRNVPITFDPKGRTRVTDARGLAPAPLAVGDAAPEFSLEQLGADPIAMAELRGSVVILDFWATWCGPCKRALPELQSFHAWAKASGQPIRVFAVNTGERSRPDQTRANVAAYWTSQSYTIPVLFDLDKSLAKAYGLSSIPYTVVIGPDGVIRHIHRGYSPGLDTRLKAQVATLLDR
jgi:thiol-disulfide isomerase/thioredoxin